MHSPLNVAGGYFATLLSAVGVDMEIGMASFSERIVDPRHRAALEWFGDRMGQEVTWPEPLDGMFLVNKAKGIHKPAGLDFALSIRQSLNGPYEDNLQWEADGSWSLKYAHEGSDPNYFTNRALRACMAQNIPVGVLVQVREKPDSRYKLLGLGEVVSDEGGIFSIQQYDSGELRASSALDVALPIADFDSSNIEDGRRRIRRSIAIRRGQPQFRKTLLKAYRTQCAVSGCTVAPILEAAHIIPYAGDRTHHVQNGLLLRADLHTLFDLGLIRIDPDNFTIEIASELSGSEYERFSGMRLALPEHESNWPSSEALRIRFSVSGPQTL